MLKCAHSSVPLPSGGQTHGFCLVPASAVKRRFGPNMRFQHITIHRVEHDSIETNNRIRWIRYTFGILFAHLPKREVLELCSGETLSSEARHRIVNEYLPDPDFIGMAIRVIDVPDSAHSDHDLGVLGIWIRRITRSTENARAARNNIENEGLRRPDSRRDTWDLLVWSRMAHSA